MRKLVKLLAMVMVFVTALSGVAMADTISEPSVYARSASLYNPDEETFLYSKDMETKIYPASMTKILTAIILLEYFEPDDIIVVGSEVNEVSLDSSKAGHINGESLSVETIIRGLIVPSGNDTAVVAACAVARKYKDDQNLNYSQCMTVFSTLMNDKAASFGCTNTHFSNPHGYHADDHYTTCHDMALIVAQALKNDLICQVSKEKSYSGSGVGSAAVSANAVVQNYNWVSHNLLITGGEYYYEYATGMKTGFTDQAGNCIAATAEKDGVKLIAVISDSQDPNRWLDAKALFEYGFNNFGDVTLAKGGSTAYTADLTNQKKDAGDTLDLTTKSDVTLYLRKDVAEAVTTEVEINPEFLAETKDSGTDKVILSAPISKDTVVGKIKYISGGNVLAEADLYSTKDVEKAGIIQRVTGVIKTAFSAVFSLKGLMVVAVIVIIIVVIIIIKSRRSSRNRYSGYRFKSAPKHRRRR